MCLRRGANRSEVRPRTAEPNVGALPRSRIQAHLPGQIPIHGAPLPPCGAPRVRGCAPDPVREAPVREGAHKAANDIGGTGRIASAPASGPSANGSQPPPDPVREAPVREGAHEAANDIGGTGRIASAPANGPSANGSQPPPDPVREAPVREGAHKAANDIGGTGRNASAPASGPSANGSQPHPVAGCRRTGTNAGLRTPREDL